MHVGINGRGMVGEGHGERILGLRGGRERGESEHENEGYDVYESTCHDHSFSSTTGFSCLRRRHMGVKPCGRAPVVSRLNERISRLAAAYNTGMRSLRVALAQINPTVGDLEGNTRKIIDWIGRARAVGADL